MTLLDNTCGVDECGRGPLAGPVVAAAVILLRPITGLKDSKTLSRNRIKTLAEEIRDNSLWALGEASCEEIDDLNILRASLLAMERAVAALDTPPTGRIFIDGNKVPAGLAGRAEAIVQGDSKVPAISAASIVAKDHRDRLMAQLDDVYPGYGLAQHAGYPTKAHLDALARLGPCPEHRRSFGPVRRALKSTR